MIQIGTTIRSNDPRDGHRPDYVVTTAGNVAVIAEDPNNRKRWTRIRVSSIHTDDKPRRSGWSVIK